MPCVLAGFRSQRTAIITCYRSNVEWTATDGNDIRQSSPLVELQAFSSSS